MKKIASLFLVTTLLSMSTFTAFAADKANPSIVTNVKVTALDGGAKVTWDKATDDVGVTGYQVHYGLKPALKQGEDYDKLIDVKNVLEYTVTGLTNGTKYYFSVTAYDAAGNESMAWSTPSDASATPAKAGGSAAASDTVAPKVASAEAMNNQEVQVVFSEAIVLPKTSPQDAFDIEDQDKFEPLLVTGAKIVGQDEAGTTVMLSTSKQKANTQYKLTVGIDVKDKAGNPIVSGTSDTGLFKGSATDKPAETAVDTTSPSVVKVESVDNTHFIVNFDKGIVLSIDPSENFTITVDGNDTKKLDVLGVKLGTNSTGVEDASAVITTSPQDLVKYNVKVVDVKDAAGNKIAADKSTGSFQGMTATVNNGPDLIPPKDVANFISDKVLIGKQYTVTLNWTIPAENTDTKEQLIYKSTDKGAKYDKEASLTPDKTSYKLEKMDPGEYWFKITEKDAAGNESQGVITKIVLPKTGPEMIGLVAFSLFAGRMVTRKKKNKV
ncbi:MAG: fibronectin type III domain-containing protein [Candidatus Peregrinibacteria bacterium]|nr:fibronectin type III domain-containing protein [Candidatus Peregrinibacteria bacterium]